MSAGSKDLTTAESSSTKPANILTMKATMNFKRGRKPFRIIEIPGDRSLAALVGAILDSIKFDHSHAFRFFSKDDRVEYSGFMDGEMDYLDDFGEGIQKGVHDVRIDAVFVPKKKMFLCYDFGDSWEFIIECMSESAPKSNVNYPFVKKISGDAPKQYQTESDSDDDENDLEDE